MHHNSYLSLIGLTATYGQTRAVDQLTLQIPKGELLSLLGPSGCGKSTTLRMIAGFVPPSDGKVVLDGKNITGEPPHQRNIGVVFQSYALFPHLTALDNVGFGLRMRHLKKAVWREKAQASLETVGLSAFAGRYPSELSGGQQHRVALARALVIEPELLLLDEPLSNLDANLRGEMRDEIRSLQQRLGITTIFVTHDQQEALAMSDRVAVMEQGLIREIGTPLQLCDTPASAFTAKFLGARTVVAGTVEAGVFSAPGLSCQGAPKGARSIVLRSARLRLADAPAGPLSLTGELKSVAYLGETFETEVLTLSGAIRVITPSDLPPPPLGATCSINALPGATTFI
jgi:putative spermidine/putrescine transport system ATP-binding protein